MWMLSFASLFVTGVLCIVGTFSRHYNDTGLQRIGMFGLSVGSFGWAQAVWHQYDVSIGGWWVHVSMAVYAIGTALKVYRKQRLLRPPHASAAGATR